MRTMYVLWAPSSRRLEELADIFGGSIWASHILFRVRAASLLRYFIQGMRTLSHLFREDPDIVVVQNPPIFTALAGLIYKRLRKRILWIDNHCVWSEKNIRQPLIYVMIKSIEAYCFRRADLNTAPHTYWSREIERLGGRSNVMTIVDFVDEEWLNGADLTIRERLFKGFKWLLVSPSGGNPMERPDIVAKAIRDLDDIALVVTGNRRYLKRQIDAVGKGVKNVFFPGFLPEEEYRGLIATCDAAVNITDEPLTVPHFISEALAAGKPIVTTSDPSIRSLLGDKAVYVDHNDVDEVRNALRMLLENYEEYASRAREAYKRLRLIRMRQERAIKRFLGDFADQPI